MSGIPRLGSHAIGPQNLLPEGSAAAGEPAPSREMRSFEFTRGVHVKLSFTDQDRALRYMATSMIWAQKTPDEDHDSNPIWSFFLEDRDLSYLQGMLRDSGRS